MIVHDLTPEIRGHAREFCGVDVAHLVDEVRIAEELEALHPVRLQNDDALYGYARYENAGGRQLKRRMVEDGFYAFVCIDATSHDCRRIPGFDENGWFDRAAGGLVESTDRLNIDSTGWYHYFSEEDGGGGYARIRPLQDLLDEDGRIGNELGEWTKGALSKTVGLWEALFPSSAGSSDAGAG